MKRTAVVGIAGGVAFSAWSVATMLWPVSYTAWDVGRAVIFIAFLLTLTGLARAVARSSHSPLQTFRAAATAALLSAGITLGIYAISTRFFAHRIVQLPEYARDYAHHGDISPAVYLSINYAALLELQFFSWAIATGGLVVVASVAGWWLRR